MEDEQVPKSEKTESQAIKDDDGVKKSKENRENEKEITNTEKNKRYMTVIEINTIKRLYEKINDYSGTGDESNDVTDPGIEYNNRIMYVGGGDYVELDSESEIEREDPENESDDGEMKNKGEIRKKNSNSSSDMDEENEPDIRNIRNNTIHVVNANAVEIKRGACEMKNDRQTNDNNESLRDTNMIEKKNSIEESGAESCHVRDEKLIISTIGPVQEESEEDKYILMIMNMSIRKVKMYDVRNKDINTIIDKLRIDYFEQYGRPGEIVTEIKERYRTEKWRDFAREMGFSSRTITDNDTYSDAIKIL